jgi:protein gp37
VRLYFERLGLPLHWRKPRRIFVDFMGDPFHPEVPDSFLDRMFAVMALCPQHTFQLLTKRAERMAEYCANTQTQNTPGRIAERIIEMRHARGDHRPVDPLPHLGPGAEWYPLANVHLGVSIENQTTADERIPLLLQALAAVRIVSYEPALGPADLRPFLGCPDRSCCPEEFPRIDWLIAGGESGPQARPSHPDWFRSVRDQCQAAGVSFFFKQWGAWAPYYYALDSRPVLKVSVPIWGKSPGWATSREVIVQSEKCISQDANMVRVGKKRAGHLLDGKEWRQFPARAQGPLC